MNVLNLFGIQAYDTTWALAMAVERVGPMNYCFLKLQTSENSTDLATLGTSEMCPRILKIILNTSSKGLSGEFHLVEGQLESSGFQVFNVIGKGERVIGYSTPKKGLSWELDVGEKVAYSTSMANLKKPIWPGDSTTKPKGWVIPTRRNTFRIGVLKKEGFQQFVEVKWDSQTKKTTHIGGLSIEVLSGELGKLPFAINSDFIPYMRLMMEVVLGLMTTLSRSSSSDAPIRCLFIVVHSSETLYIRGYKGTTWALELSFIGL
ncbi:hypothetical protein HHK36_033078 [Tetracentron sinense]|uniref:Receptor ligand binding region domain-containing protein n=1 Tax=Tetracentron sinense TaxID=13715 RepID=A0A835CZ06_TETSI|nr:hypothetical protein HHK36_033078 [Tetracentron sinense]